MSSLSPIHQEHEAPPDFAERRRWFLTGLSKAISVPGLILCTAHIGFAGLAQEAGVTMWQAVFMVPVVWALPAMVILLGTIMTGGGLFAAAFAVMLSSVRLAPMVMSLVPELRSSRTSRLVMYALAHFVAVTSWVIAMETIREVPKSLRTSYYFGLGSVLIAINMVVVGVVYLLAPSLPPLVVACLYLLTPMYFVTSLWGSARENAAYVAMALGLVLGPLLHRAIPGFDLLAAGLIGGGLAYLLHLVRRSTA